MSETALHAHRLLLRTGLSLVHIFAWVFVFEYFYFFSGSTARALAATVLLYGLAQLITLIATPISAAHLRRGTRHSIIWGVVCMGGALVVLGGTLSGYFSAPFAWGIVAFAVLMGFYRALYWIPYRIAQNASKPHEHMRPLLEVLIALMPLFAGLTIQGVMFGEGRLLFGGAALVVVSIIPLFLIADAREKFSWPYLYTYRQLLRRKNHGLVVQSLLEGLQGAALFLVWPLAVFLILEWSYFVLGLVFTITLLAILLMRRVYLWLAKTFGIENSPVVHTVLVMSGWVGRLAAGTPLAIIVADSYSYATQPERGTRADPFTFEHMSDRGAFVDEYTALKEISLAFGRIMMCAIVFALALVFALPVVFAVALGVAAASSGIAILVARRGPAPAY